MAGALSRYTLAAPLTTNLCASASQRGNLRSCAGARRRRDDADFEGLSSEKAGAEALAALRASGLTAVPRVQPEPVRCDELSLTHMRVFS
jgi:hypothetical protein